MARAFDPADGRMISPWTIIPGRGGIRPESVRPKIDDVAAPKWPPQGHFRARPRLNQADSFDSIGNPLTQRRKEIAATVINIID